MAGVSPRVRCGPPVKATLRPDSGISCVTPGRVEARSKFAKSRSSYGVFTGVRSPGRLSGRGARFSKVALKVFWMQDAVAVGALLVVLAVVLVVLGAAWTAVVVRRRLVRKIFMAIVLAFSFWGVEVEGGVFDRRKWLMKLV